MESETVISLAAWPPVTIDIILSEIASGKSLVSVLESNPSYPSRATWNRAVADDKEFSKRYVAAVQLGVAKRHGH
jgi:hypothetical protein